MIENVVWGGVVDKPFPEGIVVSVLRTNLVSVDVVLGELTVPWEESIAEAHEW